jgi:hypothetical protein
LALELSTCIGCLLLDVVVAVLVITAACTLGTRRVTQIAVGNPLVIRVVVEKSINHMIIDT